MHFEVREPALGLGTECEIILRRLPEWFGIESAISAYTEKIDVLPTYTAVSSDITIGFLSIERHFQESAEIHVMGILREFHYRGIGRSLLEKAESVLRMDNVKFLQVKTLSPSRPNEAYRNTRRFYSAAGFSPLEEMAELWGAGNPCLIMVKSLGGRNE